MLCMCEDARWIWYVCTFMRKVEGKAGKGKVGVDLQVLVQM